MSVNVRFRIGQKKGITANYNVSNEEPIKTIFRINAPSAAFSSITGSPYDNANLKTALDAKADKSELDADVAAVDETINDLETIVTNNYNTLDNKIDDVQSDLSGGISTLESVVSSNYTTLDGKIDSINGALTDSINGIDSIINGYGDIVTHNVSEFATAAQGLLADSALQPNDNISELVNNVGYITSASLPTVNNGTLTIQANSTTVGTFTANQSGDTIANITIPTDTADLTNGANFVNTTDLASKVSKSGDTMTGDLEINKSIYLTSVAATAANSASKLYFGPKSSPYNYMSANTSGVFGIYNSSGKGIGCYPTQNLFPTNNIDLGRSNNKWKDLYLSGKLYGASTNISITNLISGANKGATAIQPNDNVSLLTNDAGYITSASLPTVNDATITIQKNGTDVNSFTLNQASDDTINITVPTTAADVGALPNTTTINDLTTAEQQAALNSGATTTNIGQIATNTSNISSLSNTVTSNYNTLDGRITSEVNTLNGSISTEVTNRQNADNALQTQIDAITSASDVFDIVGTYAELQAYDISTVPVNDIIKVLVDSTHDNAATYYRCVENNNVKSWNYIGAEGAYYTKSEADNKFVEQTITVNGQPLSSNVTLTASDVGALPSSTTIGAGVLTIQKNGSNVDTFSANATSNKTINITVPTDTNDLTNGAGFITSNALTGYATETWVSNQGYLTAITSSDVTTALGYTPYNSTNPDGYITAADLPTNYVTTDTAQDISGRKTFIGEKAIYFKQSAAADKLGFTLYNASSAELGAMEWRPNTINGNALFNLNCSQSGSNYVGFRYWSGINIVAPRPTTNGNYFIPTHITNGTLTVTANNTGTVDISTLLPDVSNFVTNSSLTTTLADYTLSSSLASVATSGSYNDLTDKPTIPTVNNATITFTQGGTTKGTITLNQSSDATIALDAGGGGAITVDQTYDGTSANAQSGIAMAGELANYTKTANLPLTPYFATSTTAADTATKEVSIPAITSLQTGQIICVKPTITSTVATSKIKLNNFTAYNMRYNGANITTSTDSVVWNENWVSWFVFDGTYWQFAGHGYDNNTNTTYSAMSVSEGTTGTATNSRTVRADYLKQIIQGTKLTGLDTSDNSAVGATDSILTGIGKLQAETSSKQDALVSGTNIKTVNNTSLLGSGNIDTSEIFIANGTTTYNEISNALLNGKTVFYNSGNIYYQYTYSTGTEHQFASLITLYSGDIRVEYTTVNTSNTWNIATYTVANTDLSNLSATGQAVIDGKANTSLSNLSSTGKTVLDGQWVAVNTTLANAVSLNGSSNLTYTLSLPDSTYKYEVLLDLQIETGSASGNRLNGSVSTDIVSDIVLCSCRTRTASTMQSAGSAIVPVSTSHKVYLLRNSGYNGTATLRFKGYRRIGTNS